MSYALAASIVDMGKGITAFFQNFGVLESVLVVLFFILFYFVSKTLRDNDATKLMVLYWLLLVGVGFVDYAANFLEPTFYLYFVIILSLFMLILFSTEVKKSLWDVHKSKNETLENPRAGGTVASKETVETCIGDIIRALQNMSKNNVGALIVLSKGNLPKQTTFG